MIKSQHILIYHIQYNKLLTIEREGVVIIQLLISGNEAQYVTNFISHKIVAHIEQTMFQVSTILFIAKGPSINDITYEGGGSITKRGDFHYFSMK